MLEIKKSKRNNVLTITLNGKLDTLTAPNLEAKLKDEFEDINELVFNFAKLEYISSAGLRVLLSTHKKLVPDKKMIIKNVNEVVNDVFTMTGFDSFLEIEKNKE